MSKSSLPRDEEITLAKAAYAACDRLRKAQRRDPAGEDDQAAATETEAASALLDIAGKLAAGRREAEQEATR
jgi:hypothetical protein